LFDFCAVGRPVIVAAAGEPQRLAKSYNAALAVPPSNPEALAAAIRRLQSEPALGEELAGSAKEFASAHLRDRQVERLADLLESFG
jgi:glycosyltransferase involved in cell wall biosynthesis